MTDNKSTTEELDVTQFGRVLHQRPDDPVERVARAIYDSTRQLDEPIWEKAFPTVKGLVLREARAAIAAMQNDNIRMLLVENDRAVCIGGKWDGWLFWLHPNGNWVSARKLSETEPTIEP